MSMPISSVGVHESTLGYHSRASSPVALNCRSTSSRKGRASRPVCSWARTRTQSPLS